MKHLFLAFVLSFVVTSLGCSDAQPTSSEPAAQSAPASPAQAAAAQPAPAPAYDPDVPVALEVDGVGTIELFLNPDDRVITPWILKRKSWELTETRWFVNSIRPGDTVVDIGANVGYYTVLAGKLVGDAGRVIAFEPDPVAFEILRRNVELNGLSNVVLEQKAVSNEPGSIRLYLAEENKGDHRIYQPEGEHRPFVDIEAVALDDYFAGQAPPDFLKIDTQGAELVIVQGMAETVKQADSIVIVIEYSPSHLAGFGATAEQLLDAFDEFGVAMYEVGGGGPVIEPLRRASRKNLLRRFSPDKPIFTNLLLLKGRPKLLAKIQEQLPPLH